EFELINTPSYLNRISFDQPQKPNESNTNRHANCLDKIWNFRNSDEVHLLVNGIVNNIRQTIECEPGVIDACTWGINEIMDNVIQHSESNCGFIMSHVHRSTKNINISIFDYGRGIYQSFKQSNNKHNPRNAADAITLSIQEGVTRDKNVGQGNGMWGLYNMVNINSGHLNIISGKGELSMTGGKVKTANSLILLSND